MKDGTRDTEHGTRRDTTHRDRGHSSPESRVPCSESGFTLLELLVVMTIIGILAAVAIPALRDSPARAREAALREDLFTMRSTIDQYHGDKGYYPPDLGTLVTDGYLRQIPVDPMTKSRDTWVVDYEQLEVGDESASSSSSGAGSEGSPEPTAPGIIDVHSGSEAKGLDGTVYKEW